MNISIVKDFTDVPAGRYYADGDWPGEKLRETLLIPALKEADKQNPVIVDINDVEGYSATFLEEAFGGLVRRGFSNAKLKDILEIQANGEYSFYKEEILKYIEEAEGYLTS